VLKAMVKKNERVGEGNEKGGEKKEMQGEVG